MALWLWAQTVLEDTDVESEEEAPVDQVLPGSVCSGLLPEPGSAMLLTHQKPPQVAGRKVALPLLNKVALPLHSKRRLRCKMPVQKAQKFLPAPGSGLLPPGAPRLPLVLPIV